MTHAPSILIYPSLQDGLVSKLKIVLFLSVFFLSVLPVQSQDTDIKKLKSLSIEELMDVEITSVSKHSEKLNTAASAIQVITSEAIRRSGVTSVPEALRLASNLQVAQVNSSQWAISARGFNNVLANKLLVLIDGRVVYTPLYAGVFWDVQNLLLEDIDRIEVISGPGGTLWGANAVNGVINIITKKSSETTGLYAEAAAGTELKGMGGLRYGGKISDKLFYRVYGMGFKRDNTIYPDSVDAQDSWQMAQGGLRLDWEASEKDGVALISNIYEGRPDPDGGTPVIARGSNILGRWNHRTNKGSYLQVQAYFDQTWRNFRNGFAEGLKTYDIEAQHRLRVVKGVEITYGLGSRYMDHDITNLELFGFFPGRKSIYLHNIFLQAELEPVRKLKVTLGTKVEHHTYVGIQNQPNVRLSWMPGELHTIWAAFSRAVRTPSRIDREFRASITPDLHLLQGASDFKSEELTAWELGWRAQLHETVSISVAGFYNIYDDIRSAEPGPPPFSIPITFGNGVEGNTYGAEVSGNFQLNEWCQLRGGYTFLNKDLVVKESSRDANRGTAESNDPQHQFLVQSFMNITDNLKFNTMLRFVDKLPDPHVDSYVGLDLKLAYKINKTLELDIVGQNLAQGTHTEFIPGGEDVEVRDIERSFYVKIIGRF